MSLQNRVDPWGNLHAVNARGSWMGNRGILHNADKQIITQWRHKQWVTCALSFKGRQREIFAPNSYSELFSLMKPLHSLQVIDHVQSVDEKGIKNSKQFGFRQTHNLVMKRHRYQLLINNYILNVSIAPKAKSHSKHQFTPYRKEQFLSMKVMHIWYGKNSISCGHMMDI